MEGPPPASAPISQVVDGAAATVEPTRARIPAYAIDMVAVSSGVPYVPPTRPESSPRRATAVWSRGQCQKPSAWSSGWFGCRGHAGHVVSTKVSWKYCCTFSMNRHEGSLLSSLRASAAKLQTILRYVAEGRPY